MNFYDLNVWQGILLIAVLYSSILLANILKRFVFKKSLIPNSVLGGTILFIISSICYYTTGDYLFNLNIFGNDGFAYELLEQITYHCLGIGFIAMTLRPSSQNAETKGKVKALDSGILTVSCFLIQATLGIGVTLIASKNANMAPGSGMLLCFGFAQGTGQALNIGKNFDLTTGGTGIYADMGLSLAALGFLVASIFGVMYLNALKKKGKLARDIDSSIKVHIHEVQAEGEAPMSEAVDKLSIQGGLVVFCYVIAYGIMCVLGKLLPSLAGTVFGFNFLFGTIAAVLVKAVLNFLRKKGVMKHEYANIYLMNRIAGFAFDLMIVAGICAIQIGLLEDFIWTVLVLALVGTAISLVYVKVVCKYVFPEYEYEQFFAWFGMETGTASTGMMLLREVDPKLETPVSDNMVYMNFTSIVLGFPMLLFANMITNNPWSGPMAIKVVLICIAYFAVLNIVMFRKQIFKKKK